MTKKEKIKLTEALRLFGEDGREHEAVEIVRELLGWKPLIITAKIADVRTIMRCSE